MSDSSDTSQSKLDTLEDDSLSDKDEQDEPLAYPTLQNHLQTLLLEHRQENPLDDSTLDPRGVLVEEKKDDELPLSTQVLEEQLSKRELAVAATLLQQLESTWQRRCAELIEESRRDLVEQHEQEIEQLKVKHEEEVQNAILVSEKTVQSSLEKKHSEELVHVRASLAGEREENKRLLHCLEEKNAAMMKLIEQHEREKEQFGSSSVAELASTKAKYEMQLSLLRAKHEREDWRHDTTEPEADDTGVGDSKLHVALVEHLSSSSAGPDTESQGNALEQSAFLQAHKEILAISVSDYSRDLEMAASQDDPVNISPENSAAEMLNLELQAKVEQLQQKLDERESCFIHEVEQLEEQLREQHIRCLAKVVTSNVLHTASVVEEQRLQLLEEKTIALGHQQASQCQTNLSQQQQEEYVSKMAELQNALNDQDKKIDAIKQSCKTSLEKEKKALQSQMEADHLQQMYALKEQLDSVKQKAVHDAIVQKCQEADKQISDLQVCYEQSMVSFMVACVEGIDHSRETQDDPPAHTPQDGKRSEEFKPLLHVPVSSEPPLSVRERVAQLMEEQVSYQVKQEGFIRLMKVSNS